MPVIRVFAVLDAKAGAFTPPFVAPTEGVALRVLSQVVNGREHAFAFAPEDYTVFEIGEFDEVSALLTPCQPRPICVLSALRSTQQ